MKREAEKARSPSLSMAFFGSFTTEFAENAEKKEILTLIDTDGTDIS